MICLDEENEIEEVINRLLSPINTETVYYGIEEIFNTYYCKKKHEELLMKRLASYI